MIIPRHHQTHERQAQDRHTQKPDCDQLRMTFGLWPITGLVMGLLLASPVLSAEEPPPKGSRMTCGACPSGFAVTGVTTAPDICKEGDPTLFECTAFGTNLMSVCGSCPEGYRQVGSSMVPARCGTTNGGQMMQCQLEKLESSLPDPSQGGVFCPPNCAGQMPTPGQGTIPPPPKYLPAPQDPTQ